MSGQIHADFLRLLWVLADKQMRSYYESMGNEDKIGNEVFRWARAKVFNCDKTSVGRAIAFGCARGGWGGGEGGQLAGEEVPLMVAP